MESLVSLGSAAASLLRARNETIGVAEATTGGLVSAALLSVPGASAYFLGGGVVYTRDARHIMFPIPEEERTGIAYGSDAHVIAQARAVINTLGVDWGVYESGIAGPTGGRGGREPGFTRIGIAGPVARTHTIETGSADREANMWAFAKATLDLLERCLGEA